jgi:hypothetical protein
MSALFLPDFGPGFPPSWGRFFWAKEEPAGVTGGLASADLSPQLSVEPLPASVDLFMKRAVPTLRFPNRKPRFPQAGLSLVGRQL